MSSARIERVITRVAYQIFEDTRGSGELLIFGIDERGYRLANLLASRLSSIYQTPISAHQIRIKTADKESGPDLRQGEKRPSSGDDDPVSDNQADRPEVSGKNVVIIDDVMYSGKTMYKALQEVTTPVHPEEVKLAALIDRGHRRYPLNVQYLGLHSPTKLQEHVHCSFTESGNPEGVWLISSPGGES